MSLIEKNIINMMLPAKSNIPVVLKNIFQLLLDTSLDNRKAQIATRDGENQKNMAINMLIISFMCVFYSPM